MTREPWHWFVALAIAAACAGCAPRRNAAPAPRRLTVFAAASLREVFGELVAEYERAHPDVTVETNFAGSSALATQIAQGAAADVAAFADWPTMEPLVAQGHVEPPVEFAGNTLVVALPAHNPGGVHTLEDLRRAGLRIVVAAPQVPAGSYTRAALQRLNALSPGIAAAVDANVVSEEPNVRQVLSKAQLGEADAAFVYRTDALSAGAAVVAIDLPPEAQVAARYPIAVTRRPGRDPALEADARAFVAAVLAPAGRSALAAHGFQVQQQARGE